MLAFARKQELKLASVDVAELVHNMTGLLQRTLGPGIYVRLQFPAFLPPARTDPNQLESALLNLAINGRDAMSEHGVITISADAKAVPEGSSIGLPAGDYVRLSVTDTGEGMDEATLARAAEPFFTTKGVGKGTGLGLPMVQGMAAQSGGKLILKSRKGEGVTAEVWLPVACGGSAPIMIEAEGDATSPALTILAVDDDDLVLTNTASMLEDLGHTVIPASSGAEALGILRSNRNLDLLITDQAMPHMTGIQLAHAVRKERPDLPVLLATGYAELSPGAESDVPRLTKPFMQKDLAQAIARIAAQRSPVAVS
jgi:CheY-like chemotaxis protein